MPNATFDMLPTSSPTAANIRDDILANPGFGRYFTDHMAHVRWTAEAGWHGHEVRPYGPLTLDPAAAVLHYGQEIFEGIKAYRHADGSVWSFRPEKNAERFRRSARRLALPELDDEAFVGSLRALMQYDQGWVPTPHSEADESSLYLRPFMIASEKFLGVRPAHEVDYYVIASPAGAYFKGGVAPVSIWLSSHYKRAAPGGTGFAKCGGKFAANVSYPTALDQQPEELVGNVAVFWDVTENQRSGQMIGFTEHIFVRPAWRGRKIARRLICAGLEYLKQHALTEAHLDVRAQNTGALRLYVDLGYEVIRESRFYVLSLED